MFCCLWWRNKCCLTYKLWDMRPNPTQMILAFEVKIRNLPLFISLAKPCSEDRLITCNFQSFHRTPNLLPKAADLLYTMAGPNLMLQTSISLLSRLGMWKMKLVDHMWPLCLPWSLPGAPHIKNKKVNKNRLEIPRSVLRGRTLLSEALQNLQNQTKSEVAPKFWYVSHSRWKFIHWSVKVAYLSLPVSHLDFWRTLRPWMYWYPYAINGI